MTNKNPSLVKELKKVKAFEIQRLCKRIRILKGKKGTDQQRAKNERKVNRLLQDLDYLKDIHVENLALKITDNNYSELENVDEDSSTVEKRVLAKIMNSKYLIDKLSELKNSDEERLETKEIQFQKGRSTEGKSTVNEGKSTVNEGKSTVNEPEELNAVIMEEDEEGGQTFQTDSRSVENLLRDQDMTINKNDEENAISRTNDKIRQSNIMQKCQDSCRKVRSKVNLDSDQIAGSGKIYESILEESDDDVISDSLSGSMFVGLMSKGEKKKRKKAEISKTKGKNKNRMGQRERRKMWEKMYGEKADHKKKEKKFVTKKNEKKSGKVQRKNKIPEEKSSRIIPHQNQESLHPSWEASRRKKLQQNVEFQGKKITFED